MIQDVFRLAHTTEHPDAVAAFERATEEVAAHRPGAGVALAEALASDPQLVAAHCLKGFAQLILARSELQFGAEAALLSAEQALQAKGGGSEDETLLVFALRRAIEGKFHAAADLLETITDARPTVFLPLKLSHALRFMVGDLAGMLKRTEALVAAYDPALDGYGYFLGCHAFGLEEAGRYEEAERTGRAAALAEPKDAWGIHAVAHVCEMRHQPADGIAWIDDQRASWTGCNNFAYHLSWHQGLFHLEQGDSDAALHLYDTEIRAQPTDDFRDITNAASLLWRLTEQGIPVGTRWEELADRARHRKTDGTYMFAALHHLLSLLATGDFASARDCVAMIGARAEGTGDQARVAGQVARDLAQTLLRTAQGQRPRLDLPELAERLPLLGGSHAQRDVFMRALAQSAARQGNRREAATLLRLRAERRRVDRFAERMFQTLATVPPVGTVPQEPPRWRHHA
jgi:tetratricopeptide (TPR) repeat protein